MKKDSRNGELLGAHLRRVLNAKVYDVASETPLEKAEALSARTGCDIWLKREDLQPVHSFKLRGAYNKMSRLPREVLARGVLAASAGNHAQGVALAARKLGCKATIVMPVTTPEIKVAAVRALGAEIVQAGDSYSDCAVEAARLERESGLCFIPPYDDLDVIAGQGTLALEILRQRTDPVDAVFVQVGGGGLAAGVAALVKAVRPEIKVFGVEPEDSDCMRRSIEAGRRAAIKDGFEATRAVFEPAGALAVAAAKKYAARKGRRGRETYVCIVSGANMNFDRIRFVSEQTEIGEGREAVFDCEIPERPGAFKSFIAAIGGRNITEFNYRRSSADRAHVFVGMAVRDRAEASAAAAALPAVCGLGMLSCPLWLPDVGGCAGDIRGERVFAFRFPERPGALRDFLDHIAGRWDITLFHYRSHGSDQGRVLCGFSVPEKDRKAFDSVLSEIGYLRREVTEDPAYRHFLGGKA